MSFAVLSPAFRGLQFPFRDMCVLTFDRNSFTGNNGRPSYIYIYPSPLSKPHPRRLKRPTMPRMETEAEALVGVAQGSKIQQVEGLQIVGM